MKKKYENQITNRVRSFNLWKYLIKAPHSVGEETSFPLEVRSDNDWAFLQLMLSRQKQNARGVHKRKISKPSGKISCMKSLTQSSVYTS